MLKHLKPVLLGCLALAVATPALAQVKQTRDQILFYTSQFKGERFADGRPKVPDDILRRMKSVSAGPSKPNPRRPRSTIRHMPTGRSCNE